MSAEQFVAQAHWVRTLGTFATIWGIAVMIFWMVCGWRAMRAHERIAECLGRSHLPQAGSANAPRATNE